MTFSLIASIVASFFIPASLFGIALYYLEDYLPFAIDRTLLRPIVSAIVWPIYLAILGIYFIYKNNLGESLIPKSVVIVLSIAATVHAIHMMYLKFDGLWSIVLRINKTSDAVTQLIALSLIGIALLILAIIYSIGFFVLKKF